MSRKKSAAERRAEGNPGHRPIDRETVQPKGIARAPRSLSPGAKRVWKQTAPALIEMGCLRPVDSWGFGRWCEMYVQWRLATDHINAEGAVIAEQPSPFVRIARDLGSQMTRLETLLGMSPSARVGLAITPKADTDEPSIKDFAAQKPRLVKGSAG